MFLEIIGISQLKFNQFDDLFWEKFIQYTYGNISQGHEILGYNVFTVDLKHHSQQFNSINTSGIIVDKIAILFGLHMI